MFETELNRFFDALSSEETALLLAGVQASPEEIARVSDRLLPRVRQACGDSAAV